jgi:hypothetical protein
VEGSVASSPNATNGNNSAGATATPWNNDGAALQAWPSGSDNGSPSRESAANNADNSTAAGGSGTATASRNVQPSLPQWSVDTEDVDTENDVANANESAFGSSLSQDYAAASGISASAVAAPSQISLSAAGDNSVAGEHADRQFESTMADAQADLDSGQLDEALLKLTPWFGDPRLSEGSRAQLVSLLDQLAGSVIYSREHFLEPPYEVKNGDTLENIAERYQIPWQLLAKINGITDPRVVQPGEVLKVVRGPFAAVVDLTTHELTLVLSDRNMSDLPEDRYAGRFPVRVNLTDALPSRPRFAVLERLPEPPVEALSVAATKPPGQWIGLEGDIGIHGGDFTSPNPGPPLPNCIQLSRRDMENLHDILSVGSNVFIRR